MPEVNDETIGTIETEIGEGTVMERGHGRRIVGAIVVAIVETLIKTIGDAKALAIGPETVESARAHRRRAMIATLEAHL